MEQAQDSPRPKLFSRCTVYGKFGVATRRPAVIIWGADDKIGVYLYDPETNQYTAKVVEAYVHEISEVMVTIAMLSFHVSGKAYQVDFDPDALAVFIGGAAGGVGASLAMKNIGGASAELSSGTAVGVGVGASILAEHMVKDSGIDEWTVALKNAGLTADTLMRNPTKFIVKFTLIGFVVVMVVCVLVAFITMKLMGDTF